MKRFVVLLCCVAGMMTTVKISFGHCDTKAGPVVLAAQKALSSGNVNLVLVWVQPKDEPIVKEAFQKTLETRKLSPAAGQVADNYFFETLVRIHRAGEGASYTGLKDSAEVEIPIAKSDKAVESGSIEDVMKLLNELIQKGVNEKFNDMISKKDYNIDNVSAGREFVESYVMFTHYVEGIYNAANTDKPLFHGNETEHATQGHTSPSHEVNNGASSGFKGNGSSLYYLIIASTLLIILLQFVLYKKPVQL